MPAVIFINIYNIFIDSNIKGDFMLKIIPVMDLSGSIAVSGTGGNRSNYTPLNSVYSSSSDPISIANGLKMAGANELYIADLDLIEKKGHNLDKIKMINSLIPLMLGCGISDFQAFKFFLDFAYKLIVATETLSSIEELYKIFDKFPKERIVVSVDIKNNELFSKSDDFNLNLNQFKEVLMDISPNEIILLDISNVGTAQGINYDLINKFTDFNDKLILGGGIRNEDLLNIEKMGIHKVLIGTDLHNGKISLNLL